MIDRHKQNIHNTRWCFLFTHNIFNPFSFFFFLVYKSTEGHFELSLMVSCSIIKRINIEKYTYLIKTSGY